MRAGQTLLPHQCYISKITVFPSNWNTKKASLLKDWYIKYRFYDPLQPVPKMRTFQGMNHLKDLSLRQTKTRELLDQELAKLQAGWNPFKQGHQKAQARGTYNVSLEYKPIEPTDTLREALLKALTQIRGCKKHKDGVIKNVKRVIRAAEKLQYDQLSVENVSGKHFRRIFIQLSKLETLSDHLYNRIRTHLKIVWNIIVKEEASDRDPFKSIDIKSLEFKHQSVLTLTEIEKILQHLQTVDYNFYRFVKIFYHTASRPVELCRLRKEDVNIQESYYLTRILKKKITVTIPKPIHKNTIDLWSEIVSQAKPGEYLFSHGYQPGPTQYVSTSYSQKFTNLVKNKIGIDKNLYTMKHRKLEELRIFMETHEGIQLAKDVAQHAASHDHFSTTSIYLIDEFNRMNKLLQKVKSDI